MKSDSGAVSIEAKLYAYRKGKDGLIVSFVLHPNDVPNELALADIGQRFGLALAQIREDGPADSPATGPKDEGRSERAKADHQLKTPQEQAVTRSAILCGEMRFQQWLEKHCASRNVTLPDQPGKDTTAKLLRHMLAIESRREIGDGGRAYRLFLDLEQAYLETVGRVAEQRR